MNVFEEMNKPLYIPLHVHTAKGSVGDSILKIKEYVKRAKDLGLKHLAITNHGSMSDIYDFHSECIENDIQPIIGCEVYVVEDRLEKKERDANHLVLIAKNDIGLKNLLYIVTDANLNGFYYKPRTDIDILREHGEGIIALSACLGGEIPQSIINNQYEFAVDKVNEYKNIFDGFYLEIQPGNFEEQITVNQLLVQLAAATEVPIVLTNDIHYLQPNDWQAHDIHVKIARKQKIDDDQVYPDNCYYFKSYDEIVNNLDYLDKDIVIEAIDNTVFIANQCDLSINTSELHMPKFKVPSGHTEESFLTKICLERLDSVKCTLRDPSSYTSRLLYELETINELGFAGYFLTVRDFVLYARANDIPVGPGRGSVCGSLVAFLTRITQVDPIKYDLLFERFLSIHRKGSIPDIDLDFGSDRREDMFKYAVQKYGMDKCALVSTFGMRKAKASLRDIARVFDIPAEIADEAAKLIPEVFYDDEGEKATDLSITDSMEIVPRLQELAEEYPEWFDMAIKLEDLPRSTSIHAAGTIISPVPLMEYIPLIKSNNENINATALNLKSAELAGFVKQDFLGLATLTVIFNTERNVGYNLNFDEHNFDDEEVWNLIGSKHTTTLFQIGSKTYKDRMYRLKPTTIEQLAACLALVRGPCISSGDDKKYMEIIEGTREIDLIHPFYDDATKDTNGVLLYQEQLMQIAVNFGFELEDSFRLMKAVAKKKMDKIQAFEAEFYELANLQNVSKEAMDRIWKIILDAGLYCFNKSHAVAYALLCYQSAYLKIHYPIEYMKNSLTNAYLRKEEMDATVAECRRMGIKFRGVDANESSWEFTIEDGEIRVGLCAIKSFGEGAAIELEEKRPFVDTDDFFERIAKSKCSKRSIVPAIFSGLFDSFGQERRDVFTNFCELRKEEVPDEIKLQGGTTFNFDAPYDEIEELLLNASLIYNPVNNFTPINYDQIKKGKLFEIDAVVRKIKKIKDRSDKQMAFLTLETADGNIDATLFSDTYSKYKTFCKKNLIVMLSGKKDGEDSCIVTSIR